MKYKIVKIHKSSAHYEDRSEWIGKIMYAEKALERSRTARGWKAGELWSKKGGKGEWFFCCAVKVEPVE